MSGANRGLHGVSCWDHSGLLGFHPEEVSDELDVEWVAAGGLGGLARQFG